MREIAADVALWLAAGRAVAVATVVKVWGSAPRPPGSKMALTADGGLAGSVSGGCVEGAVIEAAAEVLATGVPRRLAFGVSDETAWSVGLSCGGEIEILLERVRAEDTPGSPGGLFREALEAVQARRLTGLLTQLSEPALGARRRLSRDEAAACLAGEAPASEGFLDLLPPPKKLVLVGAVHAAIPLVTLARALGFETIVVDPRGAFATPERFAHADRLLRAWPEEAFAELELDESTAVALLSHDLKLDLPALRLALARPVRYVGALGSKKTHAKRVVAMREAGLGEEAIARLRAPIGLDLGGRSPEEIALAVLAEIVAVWNGSPLAVRER
jgi:xanthine dehydrogenase accessory factor